MNIGIIKWYNHNKGYGFIKPNNGDKEVFFHVSELQKANIDTMLKEQLEDLWVSYEIQLDRDNRELAANIKIVIQDPDEQTSNLS